MIYVLFYEGDRFSAIDRRNIAASHDKSKLFAYLGKLRKEYEDAELKRRHYSEYLDSIAKKNRGIIRKFVSDNRKLLKGIDECQDKKSEKKLIEKVVNEIDRYILTPVKLIDFNRKIHSQFNGPVGPFPDLEGPKEDAPKLPECFPGFMDIEAVGEVGEDLLVD